MNIEGLPLSPQQRTEMERKQEKTMEMAMEFEKIFAKFLVDELTKETFTMADNGSQANAMYRNHVTETLAGELAAQRKLGMADLVLKHWKI